MRLFLIAAFLLIGIFFSFGQLTIPKIENSVSDIANFKIEPVFPLLSKSEITIMFRSYSAWGKGIYKIISFQNDRVWHAYVLVDSSIEFGVMNYNLLKEIPMPEDSIRQLWKTLIDNDIFGLNNEIPNDTSCGLSLRDASHYDLNILTHKEYKRLSYYSPRTFEEECPGNRDRQRIIHVIDAFLNSTTFKKRWW
jgi:hypothetical protein